MRMVNLIDCGKCGLRTQLTGPTIGRVDGKTVEKRINRPAGRWWSHERSAEMKGNSEMFTLVDQVAKTAHEMVDTMHARAARMEEGLSNRSKESSQRVVAGFERKATRIEDYIEANPVMSAAIAFGLGVCATRLFKTMDIAPPGIAPAQAVPAEENKETGVDEAA